jgi:hypothetical protein
MLRLPGFSFQSGFRALCLSLLLQATGQATSDLECVVLDEVDIEASEISNESQKTALVEAFPGNCIDAGLGFHLQYSDDILYDNDKLYLGNPYTVRGYSSALSGSNAWYLRSDLTRRLHSVVNPFSGNPFTKSITVSAGLDYGDVKCEVDNSNVCGEIYGLALGLEVADANFNGSQQFGYPLKEVGDDIGDQNTYMLDLRWAL